MTNEDAKLAMQELGKLKGSEAHSNRNADRRRQECPSAKLGIQRHHGPCLPVRSFVS